MDHFENIIKTLLEHEGYWIRQSFKVNVTKQEKRDIGKHSIPCSEIDLLAFNQNESHVYAMEAKSYLASQESSLMSWPKFMRYQRDDISFSPVRIIEKSCSIG